jgi:hypothetical protein
MTVTGASILTDPPERGHIVYPYTDEARVVDAVSLYAGSGLKKGEAVVLILSLLHCQGVEAKLKEEGFDVVALKQSGQFICADAARSLSSFMVNNMPDEARFRELIDPLISRAKASGSGRVRAFGEMVSLLFTSNPAAALRLEEFWNQVVEREAICLLCTYQLSAPGATLQEDLCAAHSHYIA